MAPALISLVTLISPPWLIATDLSAGNTGYAHGPEAGVGVLPAACRCMLQSPKVGRCHAKYGAGGVSDGKSVLRTMLVNWVRRSAVGSSGVEAHGPLLIR